MEREVDQMNADKTHPDIDALMEKAFQLPPPPMPDFSGETDTQGPVELSMDELDTLAAAGKNMFRDTLRKQRNSSPDDPL
jgi:hypothetical protein